LFIVQRVLKSDWNSRWLVWTRLGWCETPWL